MANDTINTLILFDADGFLFQSRRCVPVINEVRAERPAHGLVRTEPRTHRFRDTYFRSAMSPLTNRLR